MLQRTRSTTRQQLSFRELNPSTHSSETRRFLPDVTLLYDARHLPSEQPNICGFFGVVLNHHEDVVAAVQANTGEDQVWVSRLAVAGHLEGQGIGAALLGRAASALARTPEDTILLSPSTTAEPFYGKLGFEYCEPLSSPGEYEIWFTSVEVLMSAIARRARAGRVPQMADLTL